MSSTSNFVIYPFKAITFEQLGLRKGQIICTIILRSAYGHFADVSEAILEDAGHLASARPPAGPQTRVHILQGLLANSSSATTKFRVISINYTSSSPSPF